MFFGLARALGGGGTRDDPAREARELRRRHPDWTEEDVSRAIVRRTALRCAAVAVLVSIPSKRLASPAGGADFAYQSLALSGLPGRVAGAYGRSATLLERGGSVAAGLVIAASIEAARRAVGGALVRSLRRRLPEPALAALVGVTGGALAFASARWMGRRAGEYYRTGSAGRGR